ncbi:hypothetical protein Bhyg_17530, partial [Pseudolycoriella hygida]
ISPMVDSVVSNSDDIIESLEVDQQRLHQEDQESSVTKHLFTNEIFERDDLWNVFNIVQQVDVNNPNKTSSGVWKYFGKLHYDNQIIDEGYFYCISCYANRVTKKYQTNTSTGNLIKHMIRSHDILLEQPIYRIKRENDSYTVVKEEFRGDMLGNSFNTSTDDFIYDINQILIDEVHKRPQLYDSALCRKNKHQIRQELWFEVYRKLNEIIPLERLPKIWKNIRDRYRKVRRTCEKDESKVPRYRYYEKLRFLDSVIDSSMSRSSQP